MNTYYIVSAELVIRLEAGVLSRALNIFFLTLSKTPEQTAFAAI